MVGHSSRLPARSRVQVCRAPSIRSHLLGLSPPCCSTDLESFSPLVSSDTFSFLFDHVRLPGHHFPSFFSSHRPRLVEIILWVSALFPKDSVIPHRASNIYHYGMETCQSKKQKTLCFGWKRYCI